MPVRLRSSFFRAENTFCRVLYQCMQGVNEAQSYVLLRRWVQQQGLEPKDAQLGPEVLQQVTAYYCTERSRLLRCIEAVLLPGTNSTTLQTWVQHDALPLPCLHSNLKMCQDTNFSQLVGQQGAVKPAKSDFRCRISSYC